jgi:hypothetical protein
MKVRSKANAPYQLPERLIWVGADGIRPGRAGRMPSAPTITLAQPVKGDGVVVEQPLQLGFRAAADRPRQRFDPARVGGGQ